jgi:PPM family protein phosphatase
MAMPFKVLDAEQNDLVAVAWLRGAKHKFYEDRYRCLSRTVPLVKNHSRGELFAVFDGIGSAPKGMAAAQEMCDCLVEFYRQPEMIPYTWEGIRDLLMTANNRIFSWGFIPNTDRPLGACAGTIVWIYEECLFVFHAGDTVGLLMQADRIELLTRLHEIDGDLYRYFGLGPSLEIEVKQFTIAEGDTILLLTDGVTKVFHPLEAASLIKNALMNHGDLNLAVKELARQSHHRGSIDDITILLLEYEQNH